MPDYRNQRPRSKLLWDPDYGWVDPKDPFYQSASAPVVSSPYPSLPNSRYDYEEPPPPQRQETKPVESEGLYLRTVESEEEAWKTPPDYYTGDRQYFVMEKDGISTFLMQYYDPDVPCTVKKIFTETQSETIEPQKSPVEELLLEVKEMLTNMSAPSTDKAKPSDNALKEFKKELKNLATQFSEIKEMLANAQNSSTNLEVIKRGNSEIGSRSKSSRDSRPSDGSGEK